MRKPERMILPVCGQIGRLRGLYLAAIAPAPHDKKFKAGTFACYLDFHTHLFPDQLQPKALPKLAATFGANPFTDGTASGTRAAQQWVLPALR